MTSRVLRRRSLAELYQRNRALIWVMAACALYALAFIARTSFRIQGERYFSLFDDAMISMQYGRNLAQGYGLVWNPGGERLEGYTNPLWVLYMAGVHLLPLPASKISLVVQLTGAALLLVNLVLGAKITEHLASGSRLAQVTAILLTAFYWPLSNWALQGMEVSLLCVTVTLSVWLALRALHTERLPYLLYLVLGVGTLVRPDMVVPLVTVWLFLLITDRINRQTHARLGLATLCVFVGGQTAFRWLYYGDVLPNTYYLKMTGYPVLLRVARGALVFWDFAWRLFLGLLPVLPGIILLRRNRGTALLLSLIAAQCWYSIYVGGDAWEWAGGSNRYISIVMPLVFVLVGCGVGELTRRLPRIQLAMTAAVLITAVTVNLATGWDAAKRWLLLSKPLLSGDVAEKVQSALLIREVTTPQAMVAIRWAGAAPYFMERPALDMLGKIDRRVAHEPMHLPPAAAPLDTTLRYFDPGHLKYDYGYSIGQLKPDVVQELEKDEHPEEAEPYLESTYRKVILPGDWSAQTVYLRRGSRSVLWHRVSQLSTATASRTGP